jgi:hypothetical protein
MSDTYFSPLPTQSRIRGMLHNLNWRGDFFRCYGNGVNSNRAIGRRGGEGGEGEGVGGVECVIQFCTQPSWNPLQGVDIVEQISPVCQLCRRLSPRACIKKFHAGGNCTSKIMGHARRGVGVGRGRDGNIRLEAGRIQNLFRRN